MSVKYSYAKDVQEIDLAQLTYEIEQDGNIGVSLDYINFSNPNIDLFFVSDLSGAEQTELETIVQNTPDQSIVIPKSTGLIQQIDVNKSVKDETYKTVARVIYLGKDLIGDIERIECVSYMDEGITSYDVRVVDRKNGSAVIAEKTGLTNIEDDIIDLGDTGNLSDSKTILDVQLRKNGGNKNLYVSLDSLLIKY